MVNLIICCALSKKVLLVGVCFEQQGRGVLVLVALTCFKKACHTVVLMCSAVHSSECHLQLSIVAMGAVHCIVYLNLENELGYDSM